MMPRGRIAIMAGTDGEHFAQSKTILTGEFMSAAAMVRPSGWWRLEPDRRDRARLRLYAHERELAGGPGAASKKAAGHRDRRRRVPPAGQDHRLRALRRQDPGFGRDTVITGNWGQDLALLIKAAGQAGLMSTGTRSTRRCRRPDGHQAGQFGKPRLPDQRGHQQPGLWACREAGRRADGALLRRAGLLSAHVQHDGHGLQGHGGGEVGEFPATSCRSWRA